MLNENACHRTVLVEKLKKMSYLFEVEQKKYKNIDVFKEYMELCINGKTLFYEIGHYHDSEFLKRIKQYELQNI